MNFNKAIVDSTLRPRFTIQRPTTQHRLNRIWLLWRSLMCSLS